MGQHAPQLDLTLTALADGTRRAMLERLARGEARVTELARPFAMSLPAVSKHLRVLERAGLVHRRRRGREHIIGLDPGPLAEAEAWVAATRAFWEQRLDALEVYLQAQRDRETPRS